MIYVLSIDWLAIHCHYIAPANAECENSDMWEPVMPGKNERETTIECVYPWRFKLEDYGTRQFKRLHRVSVPNEQGGWDDFAEVQSLPYSGILNRNSVIVRFVNRTLYRHDFWNMFDLFLEQQHFIFKGISRIDICADFNQFLHHTPIEIIEGFAAKKYRHIGQGVGALYFNHGVMSDKITRRKDYGVNYTGLSFGTHGSDLRVYLYNKSFELMTQGEKPWIRDRWNAVGLDGRNVWRLEVSLKSKACKFKDRTTGQPVVLEEQSTKDEDELSKIYHTLVQKKFDFRINQKKCTNVSRLERIQLFSLHPVYDHRTLRNVSPGNKFERMFIKALYQLGDLYRGADIKDDALLAQSLAYDIANTTNLNKWLSDKIPTWEKPNHK